MQLHQYSPAEVVSSHEHGRVLVADDQFAVTEALRLLLKAGGCQTDVASTPREVVERIARDRYDLLLMDMNYARDTTSGKEGLDLVEEVRSLDPSLGIVVMTAWSTIDLAVAALQRGASDFIQKPWENAKAIEVVQKQVRLTRGRRSESARVKAEHEEAAQIHQLLMGAALREFPGLTVAAGARPSRGVGGDYYDALALSDSRTAFCIADCVGHGLSAALLMSNLQAQLRAAALHDPAPAQVCSSLNRGMAVAGANGKFTSFFYALIDIAEHALTFTNAGHGRVLLVRRSGEIEWLTTDDAVLGAFERWDYREKSLPVGMGDRLVLMTDGITEAIGADGRDLGEELIARWAEENRELSAGQLQKLLLGRAMEYCGGRFMDDATLMVVAVE